MPKLRYSGNSNQFAKLTVKELRDITKQLGIKNRSDLKTRFQLIQAIENVLS